MDKRKIDMSEDSPKDYPEVIPPDASGADIKRWLAAELVAKVGWTPERAQRVVTRVFTIPDELDSDLPQ